MPKRHLTSEETNTSQPSKKVRLNTFAQIFDTYALGALENIGKYCISGLGYIFSKDINASLNLAVVLPHPPLIQYYLSRGALKQNPESFLAVFSRPVDPEYISWVIEKTQIDLKQLTLWRANALQIATRHKRTQLMHFLIDEIGIDPQVKPDGGISLLEYAVDLNDMNYIKLLIDEFNIDPHCVNSKGENIADYAIYLSQVNRCDIKLAILFKKELGIKPNMPQAHIYGAIDYNNIDLLRILICELGIDPNVPNENGENTLDIALKKQKGDVIQFLTKELNKEFGIKPNMPQEHIRHAIDNNNVDLLRILICELGIDPHVPNENGENTLDIALKKQKGDVIQFLTKELNKEFGIKPNMPQEHIRHAIDNNNVDLLRILICELGIDPHVPNENGDNALHFALNKNKPDVVKFLTKKLNMNINTQNSKGENAFQICVNKSWCPDLDLLSYLVKEHGMDLGMLDRNGESILKKVILHEKIDMLRFLIAQGVDLYAENKDDYNALLQAATFGRLKIAHFLINEYKMSPHLTDQQGNTALHAAANSYWRQEDLLSMMIFLIEKCHLNPYQPNHEGNNALHLVARSGNLFCLKYLVNEKNMHLAIRNHNQRTALDIAVYNHKRASADFLVAEALQEPTASSLLNVFISLNEAIIERTKNADLWRGRYLGFMYPLSTCLPTEVKTKIHQYFLPPKDPNETEPTVLLNQKQVFNQRESLFVRGIDEGSFHRRKSDPYQQQQVQKVREEQRKRLRLTTS